MRFATVFLGLAASALAVPAPDSPKAMAQRFAEIPECTLPEPGTSCSGAQRKDVIVQYGKNQTQEQKDIILNAAKASGAEIHQVMNTFG